MKAVLNVGETASFELSQALLIYSKDSGHYARNQEAAAFTTHPIVRRDGRTTIGPGSPITIGTLESLAAAVGKNIAACYLPPTVISVGFGQLIWWCPAGRRRIWFKADGRFNGGGKVDNSETQRVTRLNGKFTQHPPLVFAVRGQKLAVFALATNERPEPATPLYRAPYWNLWEDGVMCRGDRHVTNEAVPAAIPEYQDAFFNSAFTHTNITRLTRFPGGHAALWEDLARRKAPPAEKYWSQHLNRLNKNLGQLISSSAREFNVV